MKFYNLILIILIVFLKTGNVLSKSDIFDVNNIQVEKRDGTTNISLANQAIKNGFDKLINKILLKEDLKKIKEISFSEIKELVNYYQVSDKRDEDTNLEKINFNISFDKDKIHELFYRKGISYSEISNKELFILPILKKDNKIFIYNKNIYYEKWNDYYETEQVEFILPLENIEIIENINKNKNNLLQLELSDLFKEYSKENLALVLIDEDNSKEKKIYFKVKILGKNTIKNFKISQLNLSKDELNKKIISEVKKEITYLVKSQNLIDVTLPSFLNVRLKVNNKNNLVELRARLKKIDSVENIYVQEFNNEIVTLKIKFLGNLDKIIRQLEKQNISLKLIGDQWSIQIS